jgi:probable addiction module antidote protein
MAKIQTRPWDAAEHLETDEDMAAYLEAALEEGDPALVAAALGDIARAKGMAQIARETGLGRESLYKALSPEGNPEFATVLKVVRALACGCATRPTLNYVPPTAKPKGGRCAFRPAPRRRSGPASAG